jgi:hypothetical protein
MTNFIEFYFRPEPTLYNHGHELHIWNENKLISTEESNADTAYYRQVLCLEIFC